LPGVAEGLDELSAQLAAMHKNFEEHFTPVSVAGKDEKPAAAAAPAPDDVPLSGNANNEASSEGITIRFDTKRCIHSRNCVLAAPRVFLANTCGAWLYPEADTVEHLVQVAHSCPSGAITYKRLDGGAEEAAPEVNVVRLREKGPYAFHAALKIDEQPGMFRATLCRCGASKNKPFCDNSHVAAGFDATGEADNVPSEPLDKSGGELQVVPVKDGPLKVRGPLEICSGTGHTVSRTQYVKLCRCGGSANKPFCDDTHLRIGFKSGQ